MERSIALQAADPRWVTTPLNPGRFEELLQALGLFEPWKHVTSGLRTGFSVGINQSLLRTRLFRKSCFFVIRHHLYRSIHCGRTICRKVLFTFLSNSPGGHHWAFRNVTTGFSSQTTFIQIPHDTGSLVPSPGPPFAFYKFIHLLRRFPNRMGNFYLYGQPNFSPSSRLPGSHVRHFCSVSHYSCSPRPTELYLYPLA